MWERYFLRLRVRHSSPSSRMTLSTVLGDADAGRLAQRGGNAPVSVSEPKSLAYLRYGRPLGRLPVGGGGSPRGSSRWNAASPMSFRSVESGCSRLSDFTISCFRLLPRGPSPRRPFVLRSPPPSRGGRTAARGSPRSRAPSSFAPMDGRRGRPRLPLGIASLSPVSARRCARRARGRGHCSRPRREDRHLRREA